MPIIKHLQRKIMVSAIVDIAQNPEVTTGILAQLRGLLIVENK
jgi:hypothetical protein